MQEQRVHAAFHLRENVGWIFAIWTHVKRVSQRSAEFCGFSQGAPVSSQGKVNRVGKNVNLNLIRNFLSELLVQTMGATGAQKI
jgi:hypothetical protein